MDRVPFTPARLCSLAQEYTDAGEWQASWHWEKDKHGYFSVASLPGALKSLGCDPASEGKEIAAAVAKIRRRYEIAESIRAYMEEYA
jgi:hypothetical protein